MDEKEMKKINALIAQESKKLHEQIGLTVDAFIISEGIGEGALALNIVFNALANNMRAIVANNPDIPKESVELMIQSVSNQIRKGYEDRISNQN